MGFAPMKITMLFMIFAGLGIYVNLNSKASFFTKDFAKMCFFCWYKLTLSSPKKRKDFQNSKMKKFSATLFDSLVDNGF